MNLQDYLSEAPRGTASALAKELGVTPVMLSQWTSEDAKARKLIPMYRCLDIFELTKGVVTCEEMRPDINWAALRAKANRRKRKPAEAPA